MMVRRTLILGLLLCGVLAAAYPVTGARSASDWSNRADAQQRERVRFTALAETMGLCWVADSSDRTAGRKLILSDFPVSFERQVNLRINYPDFAQWQGTVAVYVGAPEMWTMNHDPEHPERCAILGASFVYGDPELIERLRAVAQ